MMINRLKVMELVRYNINTNLNALQDRAIQENTESAEDTVSAVFATGISLVAAKLGESLYSWIRDCVSAPDWFLQTNSGFQAFFHTLIEGILVFILFVAFFFASFFLFRIVWKKIKKALYANKSAPAMRTLSEYKKIMDDFDHIACDAILFSQHFIDAYRAERNKMASSSGSTNGNAIEPTLRKESARFDAYEAIYYLKKAELITADIFLHGAHCINSKSTVDRISIHRLENMVCLMETILADLENIVDENKTDMATISSDSLNRDYMFVEHLTADLRKKLDELLLTYSK